MVEYDMYKSGMSIPEVSEATGIPRSTLRFRFKKAGILRSRADGVVNAGKKGRLGTGMRGKKRVFSDEWKSNIAKGKTGVGKGVSLKPSGYIELTMGENKGRGQHVVVMEEFIGRKLFSNECVHHKDHDKTNNSLDNLELMTRSEHARLHAKENSKNRNRNNRGQYK
jgi:hypothetical protein